MDKKKKLIIEIILFIVLLIGITAIYSYFVNNNMEQSIPKNTVDNDESKESTKIIEIENTEQFELEVIKDSGVVFIDFYATWCMPCKTMNPIIEEISKEHEDIKFVKIDIDKNEDLAIRYNVMSIPTMKIMRNGEVIKTFVGITNKESIVKELQNIKKMIQETK